ncbi:unnamed protein product [Prunus armeniaca]|uniref:Uncharacterized protein n=1 Tax=Prunus armeniaca TaxID=36596 RepID=A0A6J5VYA9_PRUAR|nr:unnamed protein product [Prunus armeniaca]
MGSENRTGSDEKWGPMGLGNEKGGSSGLGVSRGEWLEGVGDCFTPKPHFSILSETLYSSSSSSFSWSSSSSSSSAMANPTLRPPIFRASVLIAGKLVALLIGLGVKVGRGGGGGGRLSFRALGSVGGFRALGSVGFSSSGQREGGR